MNTWNTCFRLSCFFVWCLLALKPASAQVFTAPTIQNFGSLSCTSGVITTTIAIQNTGVATLILSGGAVSPTNADFSIVSPASIS
ncbi:MAG: hypothetical protein JNN25_14815, partial [Candidatus Kapabacteria bacterium]|nr:hypothetical protein [Candidatus Kapabacteria bacterium]